MKSWNKATKAQKALVVLVIAFSVLSMANGSCDEDVTQYGGFDGPMDNREIDQTPESIELPSPEEAQQVVRDAMEAVNEAIYAVEDAVGGGPGTGVVATPTPTP